MYSTVDVSLPMIVELFLNNVLQVIAAVAVIAYVSPWFLIAVVPLAFMFFFLMSLFHTCSHQLKNLDNVTRSPVLSHATTSVQGVSTIHAYGQATHFVKK